MTRLCSDDVRSIPRTLSGYEKKLVNRTGLGLKELAVRAAELMMLVSGDGDDDGSFEWKKKEKDNLCWPEARKAAVVPISAGRGEIEGFCTAVSSILDFIGFDAAVMDKPDVTGLASALSQRSSTVFMADDETFIALNTVLNSTADNDRATAAAYVAALEAMNDGDLEGEEVLVAGGGSVGCEVLGFLLALGSRPLCCEIDEKRQRHLQREHGGESYFSCLNGEDFAGRAEGIDMIVDCTPAAGLITEDSVNEETIIAAPGVPPGFTEEVEQKHGERIIHDPLQLGVAAMGMAVIQPDPAGDCGG